MSVKLLFISVLHHGSIAASTSQSDLHWLLEQLEAVHILNGGQRRFGLVEHDERLAFGLEVRLGHDVDHVAILGENGIQRLLDQFWLDTLFQIMDVYPMG